MTGSSPTPLPYPGLRPFKREESYLFFGRTRCVDAMVDRLASTRFLAVLGTSGSGKSSLVRTGLLEALAMGLHPLGTRWVVADMHPGGQPMTSLAEALLKIENPSPSRDQVKTLEQFLSRGPFSVAEWVRSGHVAEDTNLLILADQFEEVFRFSSYNEREESEKFVDLLVGSATVSKARIFVVLTMRTEYFGACSMLPEFAEQVSRGLFLTPLMNREEYREAIEGPARVMGFTVDPALVNRLLNDLAQLALKQSFSRPEQFERFAQSRDELPLLQHALNQLWYRAMGRHSHGQLRLTLDDYETIGELSGALEKHGDDSISKTGDSAAECVERVFVSLIRGTSLATATRGPLKFEDVVRKSGCDRDQVANVVNVFSGHDCGFIRISESALTDGVIVDISHESLIRQWPRLRRWVTRTQWSSSDMEELRMDAEKWARRARRKGYLKLRRSRLAELDQIYQTGGKDDSRIARVYLDACIVQELRDKLIDAVKGGDIATAAAAIDKLRKLREPLLLEEDKGTEAFQLKPAFWAAVTGDDRSKPTNDSPPASMFAGDAGRWEMEKTASGGYTPLCWAVVCGHEKLVRSLVALGDRSVEPNRVFGDGNTLPTLAAYGGHLDLVKYLVDELKISPETRDRFNAPPIIWAIQGGHSDIVRYLVSKGESLHITTSEGWTALTEATRADDLQMVQHLIEKESFDPNGNPPGVHLPLVAACFSTRRDTAEAARLLLEQYHADILAREKDGFTCLHYAVMKEGKASAVETLLDCARANGRLQDLLAAADVWGCLPLHWAATGCTNAAELLLESGAQPNVLDNNSRTPLCWAVTDGNHRNVRTLLEWDADPNLHGPSDWPPLSVAADRGDLDIVDMLLESNNIKLDTEIEKGWTALMLAARRGHTEIAFSLLEHSARPDFRNQAGQSFVTIARFFNQLEFLKKLRAHFGKDATIASLIRDEATKSVIQSSETGTAAENADQLLQQYGSEVEAAAAQGEVERVRKLVSAGAKEPLLWQMRRVSEEAWFLSFSEPTDSESSELTPSLGSLRPRLIGKLGTWKVRVAPLSFLPGHRLLAIEHTDVPGQNEQFAIQGPDKWLTLLDWTNGPIYRLMGATTPQFDADALLLYCRFFFHWVRGPLGRFNLTDDLSQVQWREAVPEDVRNQVTERLRPLKITERNNHDARIHGTVLFKNALFATDIVVALSKTTLWNADLNQEEEFTRGQCKLENANLLLEDLPVIIEGVPGIFG